MPVVRCPSCPASIAGQPGTRIKHNADGSHTVTPPTPAKQRTDPKPRGRRRG